MKRGKQMNEETFQFQSDDEIKIFAYKWQPDENPNDAPRAIVQIVHKNPFLPHFFQM